MDFKGYIFDMDGVLRIGEHPIKGANDIIKTLSKKNIKCMISTNECRYTENELKGDLCEIGINIPNNWGIYTAGMATRDYLEEKIKKNKDKNISVGIIGETGLIETINTLTKYKNFEICDLPPKYETKLILVIGTVNKIKIAILEKALTWLKNKAKLLLTCNDANDPSSKGDFNLGMPSHILHLLKYNLNVPRPYSLGKPHPIHIKQMKKFFGNEINNDELLFVGDTMLTDIQMAEENNLKSCLVLSGNTTKDALKSYIIEPDFIVNSVYELNKLISENNNEIDSP